MKVLIVSFDKGLVAKLKKVLEGFDVIDVKNGEEALNLASPNIDVVVYDAIAGSVSEEDINNMYKQKFKDSKFVILIDDLFPVDLNNIETPKKVGIPREKAEESILEAITKEPEAVAFQEKEITPVFVQEETPQVLEEGLSFREISFEEQSPELELTSNEMLQEASFELPMHEEKLPVGKMTLLLFSFDSTIIETLKEHLSEDYEFILTSLPKDVKERAKDADVLVFDTVSGMIAQKLLIDLSKDEALSKKPYVILIDELFAIDVSSIPIENKFSYARESELSRAIEKLKELAKGKLFAEETKEESPSWELESLTIPAEEQGVKEAEEVMSEASSLLEKIIEESFQVSEPTQEATESRELLPQLQPEPAHTKESSQDISNVIELINERFSRLEELLSSRNVQVDAKELANTIIEGLRYDLEEVVRQEVRKAIEQLNLLKILREETYKAVKERLNELIT